MKSKLLRFGLFALSSLALDVATKVWARAWLRPRGDLTVLPGFFDLQFSLNSGSAFSLLRGTAGARYILLGFGLVALLLILGFLKRAHPSQRRFISALGLLCGGALGNLSDRAIFGQVTDFIRVHYHGLAWPTFNVADAALVVGAGLLLIDVLRTPRDPDGDDRRSRDQPGSGDRADVHSGDGRHARPRSRKGARR